MRRMALSIILGITTVVAMIMGGCGGGGGGSGSGTAAKVVAGTASSGAAYSGSVVLKDARGRQLSMNTTTGAFSFDVTTLTAPFILKAGTLYSIATTEGTTNINPFTHVIAKGAAGSSINIDTVFANVSSNRSNLTTICTNLPQAITNFNTSMNQKDGSGTSIYTKYGMASPPDFLNGKITIDQNVDKLFADINVTVTGSTVSVTNKSGATLMSGTYSVSGSTVSFVFTPNFTNIGALSGSVGVAINPTSASVSTSGSTTFTATVTGASNTAVTWSVMETGGGSVTTNGVYTAPSTAGTYHVKATSVADTTKSATATVVVATVTTPSISISPTSASVSTGGSTTFTATVTGTSNTAFTWSVMETGGGSVTTNGVYTAPSTAGTYHVKATSVADTTKSATATVTVTAPVASGAFPIGTWRDSQHNITLKVDARVNTFGIEKYYSGSVSYPAFSGGILTSSGAIIGDMASIVYVQDNALVVSVTSASGLSITSFAFQGDGTNYMTLPITSYSGLLVIVSTTPGYSYSERATFVKQ